MMRHGRMRLPNGYVDELRTPPSAPAGKIYEVDPVAVARLKQIMAEKAAPGKRPYAANPDVTLKPKAARPQVRPVVIEPELSLNKEPMRSEPMNKNDQLSDELVMELHGRYLAGESLHAMGAETGIAWQALMREFKRRGLAQRERIPGGEKKKKVAAKAKKKEAPKVVADVAQAVTAVEPVWTAQNEDENYKEWAARQERAEKPVSDPKPELVTAVEPVAQVEDAPHLLQEVPARAEPANVERLANAVWLAQALRQSGADVEVSGTLTIQVRF